MPSQDRIRSEQRANFLEAFATEDLALDCQTTPLVVGEKNAFLAQLLFQHLVFGPQVLHHFLLLRLIQPARITSRSCHGCRMNDMGRLPSDAED